MRKIETQKPIQLRSFQFELDELEVRVLELALRHLPLTWNVKLDFEDSLTDMLPPGPVEWHELVHRLKVDWSEFLKDERLRRISIQPSAQVLQRQEEPEPEPNPEPAPKRDEKEKVRYPGGVIKTGKFVGFTGKTYLICHSCGEHMKVTYARRHWKSPTICDWCAGHPTGFRDPVGPEIMKALVSHPGMSSMELYRMFDTESHAARAFLERLERHQMIRIERGRWTVTHEFPKLLEKPSRFEDAQRVLNSIAKGKSMIPMEMNPSLFANNTEPEPEPAGEGVEAEEEPEPEPAVSPETLIEDGPFKGYRTDDVVVCKLCRTEDFAGFASGIVSSGDELLTASRIWLTPVICGSCRHVPRIPQNEPVQIHPVVRVGKTKVHTVGLSVDDEEGQPVSQIGGAMAHNESKAARHRGLISNSRETKKEQQRRRYGQN